MSLGAIHDHSINDDIIAVAVQPGSKAARTGPLHCGAGGGAFMSEEVPRSTRLNKTDIKGPW